MQLDDPTPICFGAHGCPAMVRHNVGQWTNCRAEPEFAGHLDVRQHVPAAQRGTYRLLTCRRHKWIVRDPEPMTDEDRAELAHRREQGARALAGLPHERIQPIGQRPAAAGVARPRRWEEP